MNEKQEEVAARWLMSSGYIGTRCTTAVNRGYGECAACSANAESEARSLLRALADAGYAVVRGLDPIGCTVCHGEPWHPVRSCPQCGGEQMFTADGSYVVVPVEPTDAMVEAIAVSSRNSGRTAREVWAAALAAVGTEPREES